MGNSSEKKTMEKRSAEQIYQKVSGETASVYAFLIMVVYPFYYQNKYYNMGYAKWKFFLVVTLGAMAVLAAAFLFSLWRKIGCYKPTVNGKPDVMSEGVPYLKNFSVTDRFMLAYVIMTLTSTLLSPYREQVIWGYRGWYMGLVAQVCFVLIYFMISRCWRWDGTAIACYLTAALLVFLLAVVMRFGIDPLGLYENLEDRYIINFLTTIGQVTWYSSYVALLLPLGVFAFWYYDKVRVRILGGISTAAGFMTVVTLNSDSIFIALGILFLALFWVSLESNKRFIRFLEVLIICLGCFKIVGACQNIFAEKVILPDGVSLFFSQGKLTGVFLIIAVLFYIFFREMEKKDKVDIRKIKGVRILLVGVVLMAVFAVVIYICLNTTGRLPDNRRSSNNYLLFDEYWGNNRGFTWTIAVKSFLKGDIVRRLFGCGPDGFSLYAQSFFREELAVKWGESGMLSCAHNEWLNALVNLGILGFITYTGIFLSILYRLFKKAKEYPELIAIAIAIMCYMGHNFFCYQQIICTPVVFLFMGAGEAVIRYGKPENVSL